MTYTLFFALGDFETKVADVDVEGFPTTYAVLIAVVVGALVVAAVLVIYVLYRRMQRAIHKHEGLEKQLQTIEEKVTMVARRAYHELSLDISDLQNDVKSGNLDIPLHSFSKYLSSVLFPPELFPNAMSNGVKIDAEKRERLDRLYRLLRNLEFTQVAIHAIEQNCSSKDRSGLPIYRSFSVNDRSSLKFWL